MQGRGRMTLMTCGMVVFIALAALPGAAQKLEKPPALPTRVALAPPDLVVDVIEFNFVKQLTDARGGRCDLFNVVPTIANQGEGQAGKFRVLLERNQGPGGAYVQPCPLCYWEVAGLRGETKLTLEARQFNNCDLPSSFRVTVDSGRTVTESNERNNTKVATYRRMTVR